jgi:phenylacetate-CoA ligase
MAPLDDQLERLYRVAPDVLWAYPNPLLALIERSGGRFFEKVTPRFLITSAETFDPFLRARVLEGTTFPTLQFYGSHEFGRIAYECSAREGLHVSVDQLVLECRAGDASAAAGRTGEAVVTHLNAYTMPLIRYRLGDRVRLRHRACSCGSVFPTIEPPHGRIGDLVRLPSGAGISALAFGYVVREFPTIRRFRAIQKTLDRLVIRVVDCGTADERGAIAAGLRSRLLESFGEPLQIDVEFDDAIADDRVKFRSFISELNQDG